MAFSFPFTTTQDGALVFSAVAIRNREFTPGTEWTQQDLVQAGDSGDRCGAVVMDRTVPSAGTITLDGTFTDTVDWAVIGIEIRSAPTQPTDAPLQPGLDAAAREASLRILGDAASPGARFIEIALPQTSFVRLTMHDVRGRRVLQVWSGTLPAGRNRLEWPETSGALEQPAGIYFLRAQWGEQVLARKFLLLR